MNQLAKDVGPEQKEVSQLVKRNFYMDDFVKSVPTVEDGQRIYQSLRNSLKEKGFQLKKWISNKDELSNSIPVDDRSTSKSKTFETEAVSLSILGLQWTVARDSLEICLGADNDVPQVITQRVALAHVSSVFDPLGLVSPFTVRIRLLLKKFWSTHGQEWDEELTSKDCDQFIKWTDKLSQLKDLALRRQYFDTEDEEVDLHVFTDASSEAMCIAAYRLQRSIGSL